MVDVLDRCKKERFLTERFYWIITNVCMTDKPTPVFLGNTRESTPARHPCIFSVIQEWFKYNSGT